MPADTPRVTRELIERVRRRVSHTRPDIAALCALASACLDAEDAQRAVANVSREVARFPSDLIPRDRLPEYEALQRQWNECLMVRRAATARIRSLLGTEEA